LKLISCLCYSSCSSRNTRWTDDKFSQGTYTAKYNLRQLKISTFLTPVDMVCVCSAHIPYTIAHLDHCCIPLYRNGTLPGHVVHTNCTHHTLFLQVVQFTYILHTHYTLLIQKRAQEVHLRCITQTCT
jgi:hypothetical protein